MRKVIEFNLSLSVTLVTRIFLWIFYLIHVTSQVTHMNSEIVELRRHLEELESKNRQTTANFDQLAAMEQTKTNDSNEKYEKFSPSKRCRAAMSVRNQPIKQSIMDCNVL